MVPMGRHLAVTIRTGTSWVVRARSGAGGVLAAVTESRCSLGSHEAEVMSPRSVNARKESPMRGSTSSPRLLAAAAAVGLLLALAGPAHALFGGTFTANPCLAAKVKCVAKKKLCL